MYQVIEKIGEEKRNKNKWIIGRYKLKMFAYNMV